MSVCVCLWWQGAGLYRLRMVEKDRRLPLRRCGIWHRLAYSGGVAEWFRERIAGLIVTVEAVGLLDCVIISGDHVS